MNELGLLGKHCRDIVSDMEGICTGVVEWMFGCRQFVLQPKAEDGNKKHYSGYYFEKQLEVLDDGIVDRVEIPEYRPQKYFGKKCRDKVMGVTGICIGRAIWLFNADQYIVEIQPEDESKESRILWLDEGRIDCLEVLVEPEKVQTSRAGGVTDPAYYPKEVMPMI